MLLLSKEAIRKADHSCMAAGDRALSEVQEEIPFQVWGPCGTESVDWSLQTPDLDIPSDTETVNAHLVGLSNLLSL